jgi:hypothetical protein
MQSNSTQRRSNTKETDETMAKIIERADRQVHMPTIKTKRYESEAPSSEIVFKKVYKQFEGAWKAGVKMLIESVEQHMTKTTNPKSIHRDSTHGNQAGDRL